MAFGQYWLLKSDKRISALKTILNTEINSFYLNTEIDLFYLYSKYWNRYILFIF